MDQIQIIFTKSDSGNIRSDQSFYGSVIWLSQEAISLRVNSAHCFNGLYAAEDQMKWSFQKYSRYIRDNASDFTVDIIISLRKRPTHRYHTFRTMSDHRAAGSGKGGDNRSCQKRKGLFAGKAGRISWMTLFIYTGGFTQSRHTKDRVTIPENRNKSAEGDRNVSTEQFSSFFNWLMGNRDFNRGGVRAFS